MLLVLFMALWLLAARHFSYFVPVRWLIVMFIGSCLASGGWGRWVDYGGEAEGGEGNGGNRSRCASRYFETYPIPIPGFWKKTGPIHILECPKYWPIHILPFDFLHIYCWYLDKYRSQFIVYRQNNQPRKISERKIYACNGMSEKWGLTHTNPEKPICLTVMCFIFGVYFQIAFSLIETM